MSALTAILLPKRLVIIDPADDYSVRSVQLSPDTPGTRGYAMRIAEGPNGAIYAVNIGTDTENVTAPKIAVVGPGETSALTHDLDLPAFDVTIGTNGKIYLANGGEPSITVLNGDCSVDAVLPTGLYPIVSLPVATAKYWPAPSPTPSSALLR